MILRTREQGPGALAPGPLGILAKTTVNLSAGTVDLMDLLETTDVPVVASLSPQMVLIK